MEIIEHPKPASEMVSGFTRASSPFESYAPFGLIVFAFTAVTAALAAKLNLYIDELYSLHTTSRDFGYALEQSLGFEQQPPLFFLALKAWRSINSSDYFARSFSICCCLVTLFVIWKFGRRYFTTLPDWLAPLAVAINPFFIWVALDIRVYAMTVTLSALLVAQFFDTFESEKISTVKVAAFALVAIAGLYTQYFIGSLLAGFGIALLRKARLRQLFPFAASMLVVAAALVPLLLRSLGRELSEDTAVRITAPLKLATRMLGSTLSFAYPHSWIAGVSKLLNVPYAVIVLCTFVFILRERRKSTVVPALCAIVASMIGFFLAIIIVVQAPLEMPRHISALFAPTMLLVLGLLAAIERPASRWRIGVAYITSLLILSAADDALTYRRALSNSGDWQRVGDFLIANVEPSEPIVVFDTEGALGVRHYYRGANRIVPLPHEQNFLVFDRRDFSLRSASEVARVFPAASPLTGRVWLVFGVTACNLIEIGNSCALLDSYVAEHFDVVAEHKYNGTTVEELRIKHKRSVSGETALPPGPLGYETYGS